MREEDTMGTDKEKTQSSCWCTALLGVAVIVFAWWKVSWGAVALTVLGAAVILKAVIPGCCCRDKTCKTGS